MKKRNYIKLYFAYLKAQLIALLQYKLDFLIGLMSITVEQVLSLVFITLLFANVRQMGGWTYGNVLLIYAFSVLGRSIHIIFFDNLWIFGSKYIQNGELDRVLLKPVNPLFQIIAEKINYQGFGQVIMGVLAMKIALADMQITINALDILKIISMVLFSGAVYCGIHLIYMTLSIWITDSQPIVSSVFSLNQFAQYPITILPKIIQIVLVFIVPYAFTGFIPSCIFLPENAYSTFALASPFVSAFLFGAGTLFFHVALKSYRSTGT